MTVQRSVGPIKLQSRQGSDRNLTVPMECSPGVINVDETTKSPHSPPTGRKRAIQFARNDSVMEIPHIDDLHEDEIEAVWIHPDDSQAIRQECIALVAIMEESTSQDFNFCVRGLDQHVPQYLEMRDALRDLLYDTVGRIQCMQDADGKDYSDVLGHLCETCSRTAVANAIAKGVEDAQAVNSSDKLVAGI